MGMQPLGSLASSYNVTNFRARVRDINEYCADWCRSAGWLFINPWLPDVYGQPASASAAPIANVFYDDIVHPSTLGAVRAGAYVGQELRRVFSYIKPAAHLIKTMGADVADGATTVTSIVCANGIATMTLPAAGSVRPGDSIVVWAQNTGSTASDAYGTKDVLTVSADALTITYATTATGTFSTNVRMTVAKEYCTNPFMQGTSGITGPTGTFTLTDAVPDGWRLGASAAVAVTFTTPAHTKWEAAVGSTDSADQDGYGDWAQIEVTTSGADNEVVSFTYNPMSSGEGYTAAGNPDSRSMREGNYVAECEVEIFGTIANVKTVELVLYIVETNTWQTFSGGGINASFSAGKWTAPLSGTDKYSTAARKMILRTPSWNAGVASQMSLSGRPTMIQDGFVAYTNNTPNQTRAAVIITFSGASATCKVRIGRFSLRREEDIPVSGVFTKPELALAA
jgi:hypothetical protein